MSTKTKPNAKARQVIHYGWAVSIQRGDGTERLGMGVHGIAPAVWSLSGRKWAVRFKRNLTDHGFNARVVRVTYTEPQIVPNAKATKGKTKA